MLRSTSTAPGCLAVSRSWAGGRGRETRRGESIRDAGIAIVLGASTFVIIMFEVINRGQVGISLLVLVEQRLPGG